MDSFGSLDDATQAAIREAQRQRKQARLQAKKQKQQQKPTAAAAEASNVEDYPTLITQEAYFDACSGGRFRDPKLPPCDEALALLLRALDAGDEQAKSLSSCHYFQFSGSAAAQWNPRFNARLAWEGFFTITARTGPGRTIEPLPELQPFYSVVTWPNFECAKHVGQTLRRLRASGHGYRLVCVSDSRAERLWRLVDEYHRAQHGSNWLCREYFDMMRKASDDPTINFRMHCIELHAPDTEEPDAIKPPAEAATAEAAAPTAPAAALVRGGRARLHGLKSRPELNGMAVEIVADAPADGRWAVRHCGSEGNGAPETLAVKPVNLEVISDSSTAATADGTASPARAGTSFGAALPARAPLAGEIGFSVGGVYTSLSGWTGERSHNSVGTAQLVLLGRWLQTRGYAFWSLGHCYSPQMDYKRQLGHRIYPRDDFRQLLRRHRGPFELGGCGRSLDGGGEEAEATAPFEPLRNGDAVNETELLSPQPARDRL